jgi:hypothetical protein
MMIAVRYLYLLALSTLIIVLSACARHGGAIETWSYPVARGAHWTSAWIPFAWDSLVSGDRIFPRASMSVPATIGGSSRRYLLQLDLGSNVSFLDGMTVARIPELAARLAGAKAWYIVWNHEKVFNDLPIRLGDSVDLRANYLTLQSNLGYAEDEEIDTAAPLPIGTLGADLVRGKVIVIDYPRQRFRIADTIPADLHAQFSNIEITPDGFAVIPFTIGDTTYRALFDTGSSLFALMTTPSGMQRIARGGMADTLKINAFGNTLDLVGRPVAGELRFAGQSFSDLRVYARADADNERFFRGQKIDAITGNALFWDHVIVIDFRNGRFGMQ